MAEDTEERKRCPTCRLLLPEGTRVCPACLNKGKVILRLFGYLKPYGRYAYQAMIYTVGNAALQAFVQAGVFTQFGDTTFLVGAIGREAGSFGQVFVYQDDDDRSTAITARDGTLMRAGEDGAPMLRLFDGVNMIAQGYEYSEHVTTPVAIHVVFRK